MTEIAELLARLDRAEGLEASDLVDELRAHEALRDLDGVDAARAARSVAQHGEPQDLPLAIDLAWRAHSSGVDGAGRLFAMCTDRLSLLSGRPQRFGTITMEHLGDAHLAPVDPSVPDSMRQELGLPPIAGLKSEIEAFNREQARQRAEQVQLSDKAPFCRIWRDPTAAELRARWDKQGEPVWADGEELTFVTERPLAGAIVGPIFEIPMWRVEDLLVLTLRARRLEEAVFTYGFWPLDGEGRPAFSQRPDPDGRFRGPAAPPAPPTNEELVGSLLEHALESEALAEPRRLTIYRPPGHTKAERLPVVYATDGQWLAAYARRVDAAIAQGTVPRVVLVGAHSAGFDPARGGNLRGMEYLFGFDPARFDAHQRFFVDELARWAQEELGVSEDRSERAVFGCSDGGAHSMSVAQLHPDRFGHVIAYSSGIPPAGHERWAEGKAPAIQLAAGIYEPGFHGSTQAWHHWLEMQQIEHHWTERVCGHDMIQWVEMLPAALTRAFA